VEVGEDRLRKDLGDTEDLEKSIQKLGLLQPIAVTEKKRLVWGWRRLETWKKVKGDEPIPARIIPEKYARLAELIENICREDLPWQLKDMAIAEYHRRLEGEAIKQPIVEGETEESADAEVRGDFQSAADEKSFRRRGRPPKPWTHEDTAESLGISRSKVTTALNLVKAMEKYPELKKAETEKEALRMLQKLRGKKEKSEKEKKEKTWKCQACQREFSELEPVAPTRYTLCPDCLVEFETWKTERLVAKARS